MVGAFYEDFSDLALCAASSAALLWPLLVRVHQEERQRDQERRAGRARRPQHDISVQPPGAMGGEQVELFAWFGERALSKWYVAERSDRKRTKYEFNELNRRE